jgi:hypothetical protein
MRLCRQVRWSSSPSPVWKGGQLKVVKLSNFELPALVELPAKLCGRFALELARIAELNRFATIDQLIGDRLRHCASARIVAGDN